MKCDNASSMGHCIISPQCVSGEVTREVTIEYNEVEKDILHLCNYCTNNVRNDARRHGYKVSTRKIKPE